MLCSDVLKEKVSFYAQFELVPTLKNVCGIRYRNATMVEQYIHSSDVKSKKHPESFGKYSLCMYEIYNPNPTHSIYLNIYRLTNNSDIGIFYEDAETGGASARKSPFMPKGYKEKIQDYNPGEWKVNATIPIETEDTKARFHTFKVQYPARDDLFFDMSDHMQKVGAPYHNVSDILRQYSFEGVEKLNIVVIGQTVHSQFDMSIQQSLFATTTTRYFEDNWQYAAYGIFGLLAFYFIVLTLVYKWKAREIKPKYQ